MKILVIAPTPFFSDRGTHIRIFEQVSGLLKFKHEISILTYHLGTNLNWKNEKVRVVRIPTLFPWYKKTEAGPNWQKVFLDLFLFIKGFFYIIKNKPQIIHAHLHEGVLLGWLLQKVFFLYRIKLVADFHGSLVQEMVDHNYLQSGWVRKQFVKLESFILNLGDKAIVSGPENLAKVNEQRKRNQAVLIVDGIDLEAYTKPYDRRQILQQYRLPADKKIIIYTGAFLPNKGFPELIELYEELNKKYPHMHFVVAGGPKEMVKMFSISEELKNNLTIISPLSYFDLPVLLRVCNLAVEPKSTKSLQGSGKILGYMAAGLPIVSNSRDTNAFYTEEQEASLLEQAARLLNKQELCEAQIIKNKERVQSFSRDLRAKEINDIYHSL